MESIKHRDVTCIGDQIVQLPVQDGSCVLGRFLEQFCWSTRSSPIEFRCMATYFELVVDGCVRLEDVDVGPALQLLCNPLLGPELIADDAYYRIVGVARDLAQELELVKHCQSDFFSLLMFLVRLTPSPLDTPVMTYEGILCCVASECKIFFLRIKPRRNMTAIQKKEQHTLCPQKFIVRSLFMRKPIPSHYSMRH